MKKPKPIAVDRSSGKEVDSSHLIGFGRSSPPRPQSGVRLEGHDT
jgi:hypothetical protein